MKAKEQMERLLKEKAGIYHKDESEDYVFMYAEFPEFTFVDYVWVNENTRGKGIGRQLLSDLKSKKKPILLEVEPFDETEQDCKKRLRFYQREGFEHANGINYNRRSLATNEKHKLEILYWPNEQVDTDVDEKEIFTHMCKTYEEIHTYKDKEIYGQEYEPLEKALNYQIDHSEKDLFAEL